MYEIKFLNNAIQDIYAIFNYISYYLNNKSAVMKLLDEFEKEINNIKLFPYSIDIYMSDKKFENTYRIAKFGNYNIFYYIDEDKLCVTIVRVLHKKRNKDYFLN